MQNIWFLTEMYYPEETSTGYLLTNIAEGLAEEHSVGVITGPATQGEEVIPAPKYEVRNSVEIHRGWGTDFNKNSLIGRGVNWMTRTIPIVKEAVRRIRENDIAIVVTNPPFLPYLTLFLGKLIGFRVVLLVHDVYPEILTASGVLGKNSMIVQLWHRASQYLYRHVDRIVTLGRDMSRLIARKVDDEKRIYRIWNWAENDLIQPMEREDNRLIQRFGLKNKFVVLYAGKHGRTHGLESLARAANFFDGKSDRVHFLFAGFGPKKKWLEDYVEKQNLENVSSMGRYPRDDQKQVLNACDLAVISYVSGMAGISVPSRMYNHMAAGKPLLAVADDWSELSLVVQEEDIGWTVAPENVEGIIDTIRYAQDHPKECERKGKRAADAARSTYNFDTVKSRYYNLVSELQ